MKIRIQLNNLSVIKTKNMEELQRNIYEWSRSRCVVIPFGSCRLCGDVSTSDIDFVCLTNLTRDLLFDTLPNFLESIGCIQLIVLRTIYVPVIKFRYRDKDYDLIFACITLSHVDPSISLIQIMNHVVSQEDLRSLQALYTTEYILKYIEGRNHEFSMLLRQIKNWCVDQGIYSNALGLLNGVTLAIMCAYIIRTYSSECNYFHKFFDVFSNWNWENDVITIYHGNHASIKKGYMNVYTPIEKPLNTMYNTSFQQYLQIMSRFKNYASSGGTTNFFEKECYYISFQLVSQNHTKHYLHQSYIESKLKLLSVLFPENPFEYHTTCYEISTCRSVFFIKLRIKPDEQFIRYLHEQFIMKISTIEDFTEKCITTKIIDYSKLPSFVVLNDS
jgi:poly(A) polymerase Pap1